MKSDRFTSESLPQELIAALNTLSTVRMYEKNSLIYRQGDEASCFYYLKKGRVRTFMTSENGTEKTLSAVSSGAVLGEASFFDGQPRISSALAVAPCVLLAVDHDTLLDLIRRTPSAAMELLRLQAQTIRMLSAQVNSITFDDAAGRIARYLLSAMTQNGIAAVTHEEIAGAVGVSRVTVSKIISRLSREKILRTGYRCLELVQPEALKALCRG